MRFGCLLCVMALFLAVGCDWHVSGEDQIPDEDWEFYDYVFAGESPDSDGDDMLLKINLDEDGSVSGETTGVIYAEFTGTLADDKLNLKMEFLDHKCESVGLAVFNGTFSEEEVTGKLSVWSCEVWQFDYTGQWVGGRL